MMMGSHEDTKTRRVEEVGRRLKYVCRLGYGDSLPKDDESSGNIPVFGSNGQYSTTSECNTSAPAIVLGRKGSYGKVNWASEGCFASDTTFYIDSNQSTSNLRWLYWALQTLKLDEGSQEAAVPGLNRESVYEQRVLCPDNETQRQITDYLDRETARIDALVAEKEKMLALLEEKRAALISRAVTRGLDPTASLKPSGLDWLGDIPKHWEIVPIKYVATVGNGSTPAVDNSDYWDDEGFPWMNSSVVNMEVVTEASRGVTDKALKECHLPIISPPAVLVGITGQQGKTRGMASILMRHATINQHLAYLKPQDGRLLAEYLRFVLVRAYSFLRSDSDGAGSTKGAITCDQIANFRIPIPAIEEQARILRLIKQGNEGIKNVKKELENSIRFLRERRAALITAAVTGQIPVEEMRGQNGRRIKGGEAYV